MRHFVGPGGRTPSIKSSGSRSAFASGTEAVARQRAVELELPRINSSYGRFRTQLPGMSPFASEKQYFAISPARVYHTRSLCLCSTQCLMA
jgi:hypothetical protein